MGISQFQHVTGAGDRHLKGFKRKSPVVIGRGDAGGMNDVMERPVPVKGFGDIVIDEADVIHLRDFSAFLTRRDQVIKGHQVHRLIKHRLVQTGKDVHEITTQETPATGQ